MAAGETEVRPGWVLSMRVWWAFTWRIVLISCVVGPIFNYLIATWGEQSDFLFYLIMVLGAVVIVLGDVWVMHMLLQKRFGAYRITVMKTEPGAETP